jgi:cytochrome P450
MREIVSYFRTIFAEYSVTPKDGMIGALISMLDDRGTLSEEEAVGICMTMLFGGQETTTNLIGNGLLTLLRHPGQFRRLQHDPSLVPSAIEELLRYESPVQNVVRLALEDLEIAGTQIRKGQRIILCLGAANRDPAQFPDPDRFDMTRPDNLHVAFGYGIHYCLGAQLARLEARAAFTTILRRLPNIRLVSDVPIWKVNAGYRGLKTLPIVF